ncbi:MAG: anthranilate phosphoribosyltransferase [Candidatus Brocadiia bacterium]
MLKPYLSKLLHGEDLEEEECRRAMGLIMGGEATSAQVAGFLIALRMKGETVPEITGCARAMREAATGVEVEDTCAIDTCGTGGDTKGTFNVSTAAAIVTAAAGVTVAKHGNRSVSSSSGSADVLQQMGVNIEAPRPVVENCVRKTQIGFLFAPLLHRAMKHAIGPRRELGVRTVFNILGPLTNPAGVKRQLLGIYSDELVEPIARVLSNLGAERAMVVHSNDGMDELSVCDSSHVAELDSGNINCHTISPEAYGFERGQLQDLMVDSPEESAQLIEGIISGRQGPQRDMVVLNAGAAIYVGGQAQDLSGGINRAANAIDSGAARDTLQQLKALSNEQSAQ